MRLNKKVNKNLKSVPYKPFLLLLALILFCSHDLFIKMETYFLQPDQEATISLYNGTFERSENIISRDRIQDASIISHGQRAAIKSDRWRDQDSTITQLHFNTDQSGTYVVGVSTKPRNIELTADEFNSYLESDGVLDMLEYRTNNNLLDQDAVESYQKHVKAIYQVGDVKTNDWSTELGYPIEFVPQANPYEKYTGEKLEVKLLLDGKPLTNQLVYANYIGASHSGDNTNHSHNSVEESNSSDDVQDTDAHTHSEDEENKASEHTHDDGKHSHSHGGEEHTHEQSNDKGNHSYDETSEPEHTHTDGQKLSTNDQGIVEVDLPEDGFYYLRTIHMVNSAENDELTHMSKWATLSFEVSHKHDATTHTHDDHEHEEGIPTWIFVVVSLVAVTLLFLIFRSRGNA